MATKVVVTVLETQERTLEFDVSWFAEGWTPERLVEEWEKRAVQFEYDEIYDDIYDETGTVIAKLGEEMEVESDGSSDIEFIEVVGDDDGVVHQPNENWSGTE